MAGYRSHTTAISAGDDSYTIARPAGTSEGDILVLAQWQDQKNLSDLSTPSGWTQILQLESGQTYTCGKAWVRQAGSSEPSTYTLGQGIAASSVAILICVQGAGLPAVSASSSSGSGSNVSTPSVTPSAIGGIEIRFAAGDGDENTRTWTPPATYTEPSGADVSDGGLTAAAAAYKVLSSNAATGALNFTASGTVVSRVGFTIFLPNSSEDAEAIPDRVAAVADVPDPEISIGSEPTPDAVAVIAALPQPAASAGAGAHPTVIPVGVGFPSPIVTTEPVEFADLATIAAVVGVPDALVSVSEQAVLAAIDALVAVYAPTVQAGSHIMLGPIQVAVQPLIPEITVPALPGDQITAAGQVEWNGTLWGATTPFVVQSVEGWRSLPQLDNLNVQRPSRHGAWPARRLAQQRIVTIRLQPQSFSDPAQVDDLLDQLDQVTGVLEDETEWPLVIAGYGDAQLAWGAIVDRDVPLDSGYSVGAPSVSVMIVCSDPRRYNLIQTGVDLLLDETVELVNAGNVATHPLLRVPGPVTNPVITNVTLDRSLEFDIELESDEQMVIDTNAGTVVVGTESQMQTLTGSSVPVTEFVLTRGVSLLEYTADDGGDSPVVCLYRDSWL